ncbi:hypothetical protein LX32DRAFT_692642 [Colletotrichum zoysiae]|uniref:Uncharacterized protein n=1 Tax=Colletotrichum zoysiae TaxID=1216348 RepID=A0AAD9HJY7_9PEZI|nr:hypothetical protein LX32DRAFT_692642 [Colletotrichum zoysiae]
MDDEAMRLRMELQRHFDSMSLRMRYVCCHSYAVLETMVLIGVFEYFFFSNIFLRTLFLAWRWRKMSRWLFCPLILTLFADSGVRAKLSLAAWQSSSDFFVEVGLMFPVIALHSWLSPGQPIPDQRYVAAWGALSSVVSAVLGVMDGRHEMHPESLCTPPEPLSLYTTCSHYAALVLFLGELNAAFHCWEADIEEAGDEAPEAELTPPRIRVYRNSYLLCCLLVRLSVLVGFALVSNASGSLRCWYTQEGMKFLDWLPHNLRYLPFGVCVFGAHCLVRRYPIGRLLKMMVEPEDHEGDGNGEEDGDRDGEDWNDDVLNAEDFNDEGFNAEDFNDEDLEEDLEDENDEEDEEDEDEDDDEDDDDDDDEDEDEDGEDGDEDSTDDEDGIDFGGALGGMDDWDDNEGGADYIYIHKDDAGYVFELKDGDRFERETAYTYDGEHDYRYRYADAFGEVSVRSRATDRGCRVSYRYARKDVAGDENEVTNSADNSES